MTATEQAVEHIGETQGIANHDHDMVHELSKRLDALWRYDQYIANAKGHETLRAFWHKAKEQEIQNVHALKRLVAEHVRANCFNPGSTIAK